MFCYSISWNNLHQVKFWVEQILCLEWDEKHWSQRADNDFTGKTTVIDDN